MRFAQFFDAENIKFVTALEPSQPIAQSKPTLTAACGWLHFNYIFIVSNVRFLEDKYRKNIQHTMGKMKDLETKLRKIREEKQKMKNKDFPTDSHPIDDERIKNLSRDDIEKFLMQGYREYQKYVESIKGEIPLSFEEWLGKINAPLSINNWLKRLETEKGDIK